MPFSPEILGSVVQGGLSIVGGVVASESEKQLRQQQIEWQEKQLASEERLIGNKQQQDFALNAQAGNQSQMEFTLKQSNAFNAQKIATQESQNPMTKTMWILGGVGFFAVIIVFAFIGFSNKKD